MGVDDVVNKGKEFLEQNREKIERALRSDKAEEVSDKVLQAATEFVKKIAPDSAGEKIDKVREKVDGALGKNKPDATGDDDTPAGPVGGA
ncbi:MULTISPECIES: Rv0909 family putative TA system antitoxin [unclassified Microbacterium]|uniref:Rv0909 family putative TA system antitoxin n=1 Tax=unclassified Microbacterium TaxID=2609290 RepID=UPI0027D47847|nr:Rv0909 family putative TA system antitoxin [Microbacterium sp. zg.B96]